MIRSIFTFLFMLVASSSFGQGWQWGRGSIGNSISSWPVATDIYGNVYVAGMSYGAVSLDNNPPFLAQTGNQCVLAKYDLAGDFLWARYSYDRANVVPINIATDAKGNCYMLGWMQDSILTLGNFTLYNTKYPAAQYFIAKYDPQGDIIWATNDGGRFGASLPSPILLDNVHQAKMMGLGSIAVDSRGSIYITTCFNLPSVSVGADTLVNKNNVEPTDDILLAKYDSTGAVLWARSWGGSGEDIPFSLAVTPSENVYIAGAFNSDSILFGNTVIKDTSTQTQKWNAFIVRCNDTGNAVWANGSGGIGKTYAAGVGADYWGNVYLVGGMAEDSISFDSVVITGVNDHAPLLYLVRFDSDNNVVWYKTIGSPDGAATWGYGISVSSDIWVCGAMNDSINFDGSHGLNVPAKSVDPIFIAAFDTSGIYEAGGALQSGSGGQVGIAVGGGVFVCGGYKYPANPFVIAGDVLPAVPPNDRWLYVAEYGGGGSGGSDICIKYDTATIVMCTNDSAVLRTPQPYDVYSWSNGSSDSTITVFDAGKYWVTAIGHGCFLYDTILVKTDSSICNCEPILPNAFTPNEDGKNDGYTPIFRPECYIRDYSFFIYNRWGQQVFYSTTPGKRWDGTFKGKKADMDVYMFYLKYSTYPGYPAHTRKGDITLIK